MRASIHILFLFVGTSLYAQFPISEKSAVPSLESLTLYRLKDVESFEVLQRLKPRDTTASMLSVYQTGDNTYITLGYEKGNYRNTYRFDFDSEEKLVAKTPITLDEARAARKRSIRKKN